MKREEKPRIAVVGGGPIAASILELLQRDGLEVVQMEEPEAVPSFPTISIEGYGGGFGHPPNRHERRADAARARRRR